MLDFYTFNTLNGQAVKIALELMGVSYHQHVIDLVKGQQREAAFLAINPSGRIPAVVDKFDGTAITLSQTGAILIYLAEKHQQLLPSELSQKALVLQWMQFVLTDISTQIFNNFHLKALVSPKQPEAGEMLKQRAIHFCGEIENQLMQNTFLAGDKLSLSDVVAYPAVAQLHTDILNDKHPNTVRWFKQLTDNQSFVDGMQIS